MEAIAFFTDAIMLPGLHVALLSMLDSLPADAEAEIFVFGDGISEAEKNKLRQTHAIQPRNTRVTCIDYVPKSPEGANALHGNRSTYGRIYLANLLPNMQQCLYLDSDLLIGRSVLDILCRLDGKHTLCADGTQMRAFVLEKELYRCAKLDLTGPCFNAGVLAIDLKLWRERNRDRDCEKVAQQFSGMFKSADQGLLNVVFHDDFVGIGGDFNSHIYPNSDTIRVVEDKIYHFVGSPKPWDPLGSFLHPNYKLWQEVYARTAIGARSTWRYARLGRSVRISRSLYKAWKVRRQAASPPAVSQPEPAGS